MSFRPTEGSSITMLGTTENLKWKPEGSGVVIEIPESVQQAPPCEHAWVIKIQKIQ